MNFTWLYALSMFFVGFEFPQLLTGNSEKPLSVRIGLGLIKWHLVVTFALLIISVALAKATPLITGLSIIIGLSLLSESLFILLFANAKPKVKIPLLQNVALSSILLLYVISQTVPAFYCYSALLFYLATVFGAIVSLHTDAAKQWYLAPNNKPAPADAAIDALDTLINEAPVTIIILRRLIVALFILHALFFIFSVNLNNTIGVVFDLGLLLLWYKCWHSGLLNAKYPTFLIINRGLLFVSFVLLTLYYALWGLWAIHLMLSYSATMVTADYFMVLGELFSIATVFYLLIWLFLLSILYCYTCQKSRQWLMRVARYHLLQANAEPGAVTNPRGFVPTLCICLTVGVMCYLCWLAIVHFQGTPL